MTLEVYQGADAARRLGDAAFLEAWRGLAQRCPWGTAFQAPPFVTTWLAAYGEAYAPLIVAETDAAGGLAGLLPLAVERSTGHLVAAGAHQAEYQGWLAADEAAGGAFLGRALAALAPASRAASLRLRFLPPGLAGTLERSLAGFAFPYLVRREPTPIVDLTADPPPWASMRKKSNKSRLARLRRVGDIEFELTRLAGESDAARARQIVAALAPMYDLRQGAVNNACPFREDPQKAAFHVALLTGTSTEAFLMRVGGQVVAGIIGPCEAGVLGVGVFALSPLFARHSPGKVLLHSGGEFLAGRGIREIDLTPGGEWKWRFANASHEVAELTLFLRRSAYVGQLARDRCLAGAKAALGALGVSPAAVRGFAGRLGRAPAAPAPSDGPRLRHYALPAGRVDGAAGDAPLRRDSLDDLLSGRPGLDGGQRRRFLETVLNRLEAGEHGYALADAGGLVCSGWLAEPGGSGHPEGPGAGFAYPPNAAVLHDFYSRPGADGAGLRDAAIRQMLRDAADAPGAEWIYVSVPADDEAQCGIVEAAGFARVEPSSAG